MLVSEQTISQQDLNRVITILNLPINQSKKESGCTTVALQYEGKEGIIVPMIYVNGKWETTLKIEG